MSNNIQFVITGSKETGDYIVEEVVNGELVMVYEIKENKRTGLKESRKYIGEYVIRKYGYLKNKMISHKCVKPGRDKSKNPNHHWELNQYL